MLIIINTVLRLPLLAAHIVLYHRVVHSIETVSYHSSIMRQLRDAHVDLVAYVVVTVIICASTLLPIHRYADGLLAAITALLAAGAFLATGLGLFVALVFPIHGLLLAVGIIAVIVALLMQEAGSGRIRRVRS